MRLFVALVPPAVVLADLDRAVLPVRGDVPTLRWPPRHRWHLTLAFLGEVDDDVLPRLTERLARAVGRHAPPTLALRGAGRFDGRVLWAGVAGDVEPVRRLADSVAAAARRCGIAVDARRYRPHLTLARARAPVDLRPAVAALAGYCGPPWPADMVELVRSRLGPDPSYQTLATFPLRPAARETG